MRVRSLAISCLALVGCLSGYPEPEDLDLPDDPRCSGIAQVAAWDYSYSIVLTDTGTAVDSYYVAIHHAVGGAGRTALVAPYGLVPGDAYIWQPTGAIGTVAIRDTARNLFTDTTETERGTAFDNVAAGNWNQNGPNLIVDLTTCTVVIDVRVFVAGVRQVNGGPQATERTWNGSFVVLDRPISPIDVTQGMTFDSDTVTALAGYGWVAANPVYLSRGLSWKYSTGSVLSPAKVTLTMIPRTEP